jgi:hypothetical protein
MTKIYKQTEVLESGTQDFGQEWMKQMQIVCSEQKGERK